MPVVPQAGNPDTRDEKDRWLSCLVGRDRRCGILIPIAILDQHRG